MKPRTSQLLRQLPYVVVGLALLLIAAVAVQQTLLLRQDLADQRARQAAQSLRGMVSYWESSILRQTRAWIDELESAPDLAAAERRMRRTAPWFDAVYIWEPSPRAPRLRFQHPCIYRAGHTLRYRGRAQATVAYRNCREAPPRYHLYTSSLAAALLLQLNQPQEAWMALNEVSVPLMLPLREAAGQGLPLSRVVSRRIQGAQAQGSMGQPGRQRELLMSTARELADLDARQIDELASFLQYTLPKELHEAGAPQAMDELAEPIARAARRLDAYQEITQRLIARPAPPTGELQIIRDPYHEDGFLLAYGPIADGQLVAAIQLDPRRLLEELPPSPDLPDRIILDADNNPLTDGLIEGESLWVQVPFGRLFPHLRLGIKRPADQQENQATWLVSQLAPIALTLLLGGLAIVARMRADRRREDLYERQRDFITRVTHELKTPLAGIRLMAETLEMTAGEDPATQQTFIDRILQEADRLTARIDEVLRLTRQPRAPRKAQLSPALLADELWEEWLPRFEEVGGSLELEADLEMADIRGDAALLRDAMVNLLSNALKYRDPERPLQCTLRVTAEQQQILFEVIDNGIGVPPKMRAAIFERFTRVEGPNRGLAGGHGLGLAFVAETARAHGGSAACQEAPGGGAHFILRIPT
jgi:signal transduction histidine kinase